jgi:hypothetical protein
MYLNPVVFEKSGTMRIVLHVIIVLLKLKRKQFRNIPMNLEGIFREVYHIKIRRHNVSKENFDFSLIVDDCESSDGQKRHQYINAKETKTETEPETIQK